MTLPPFMQQRARWLLPIIILLFAVLLVWMLMAKPTRAQRSGPQPEPARWVEVITVLPQTISPTIRARGLIAPSRKVDVLAQVQGEIIDVSAQLIPGQVLKKGRQLIQIDPVDYSAAVTQAEADLAQRQADFQIEQGQQSVALQEYELIGEELPADQRSLILRKPQLQSSKAQLKSAEAALQKAQKNLQRTTVTAPFDGILVSKEVDLGTSVAINTPLFSILASEEFWLTVTLPPSQLPWLDIPANNRSNGASVTLYKQGNALSRDAEVLRLLPELTPNTKQAQLLISLQDPLSLLAANQGKPVFMANEFVEVSLQGRTIDAIVVLPRGVIREGGKVWLVDGDNRLQMRDVDIVLSTDTVAYISAGLESGDRVVSSLLKTPIIGMLLDPKSNAQDSGDTTAAEPVMGDGHE
ncbi:Multidrug resistance protein MdtA [Sinobacterium norvegicum]|uniref:Multidrug resistance protein MdtA n=1 Tax=Sinobacterium norvegicum TaxID=1641715 RepID=A0ABM9AB23_9GAMM|nr:efflux RND transporter periplasmic adaptor subunit [Sinobacterium norvegicum]CAH0990393.1 Multidrug resistance protein MdtA [Sinobacterium norvegicum]